LLLVTAGNLTLEDAAGTLSLRAGSSVVALPDQRYTVRGTGTCFRACSGE
jgi:mannose-6-phosphate isomerase class I